MASTSYGLEACCDILLNTDRSHLVFTAIEGHAADRDIQIHGQEHVLYLL